MRLWGPHEVGGVEARPQRLLKWGAIIVAAGRGTRFGRPKQLIPIGGKPMLTWSASVFAAMPEVVQIVVTTEREWLDEVGQALSDAGVSCRVVPGGATRQASVFEGLTALDDAIEAAFVHDGARPFVTSELVRAGMAPVAPGHASLLTIPVVDTIKVVNPETSIVESTPERSRLWAAQTPQFAMRADLLAAHEAGIRDGIDATDDAMLLERAGFRVHAVPGSPENFKVTLPEDLARAEQLVRERV
ncbi:MAG TPA: 2-C-methyl-D-erythritol 4-phosphate cytidylyltransferase [Candidatus Baltobacteraceae bacterium]|nr:2-C-methyl-D-erythritol 4-phosphate cytidylyltransferase [Candidatus Baltobacteraceae bacterium]